MLGSILIYTIIAIFIGISQSAGIGGGPILNICLMIGFGYTAKKSMSITYLFLMGGAAASIMKNIKKKNPKKQIPIMDFDLIMITMPMAASGSIIGTLSNHFISEFFITILFTILLSYLSYDTYKKLQTFSSISSQQKKQPLIETELQSFNSEPRPIDPALQQILDEQKKPYPKQKFKLAGLIFLYTLIILLGKGGETYESWIWLESCGFGSYVLVALHIITGYLFSKSIAMKKCQMESEMERLGHVFQEGEKMTSHKMWSSMVSGFGAGVVGGSLGLGGAIILVPVWLNSGIDKNVATSSSAPLIFFSGAVSFFMAFLCDSYDNFEILVFYFALAFAGSYIVKEVVNYIAKKYKLETMIFILLLLTMVSSLVVLLPFQLIRFFADPESFMTFGVFC